MSVRVESYRLDASAHIHIGVGSFRDDELAEIRAFLAEAAHGLRLAAKIPGAPIPADTCNRRAELADRLSSALGGEPA